MFGSLSRRHLLALSSGAALSALASACSPNAVSRPQPLTESSPTDAAPAPQSTQTKSATTTRSITYAEPLPKSALDGRGPAILPDEFFERSGNFSNGTLSHRAVNVPRPTMPPEAKERTVEGLHAFLQHWGAAQNYMLLTGDTDPFMDLPGQEHFSQMAQMYRDIYRYNIGWLVSKNNHPMCINLSSPQPVPATEQDVYCWKATLKVDENAFLFNHETRQREQLTGIYGSNQKADAYVYFGEEGWQMLEDPKSSPSATATPAATAEPSANTPSAHPTPNESTSSKATRYIRGSA